MKPLMAIISKKSQYPVTQADPHGPRMHGYLRVSKSRMGMKLTSSLGPGGQTFSFSLKHLKLSCLIKLIMRAGSD